MSADAPTTANPNETPDAPKGFFNKIGAALPIGLTALATIFAGMSSGALNEAMFWKSQAAQDESKASNQWTFAGSKVTRSGVENSASAVLSAVVEMSAAGGEKKADAGAEKKPLFEPNPKTPAENAAAEKAAIEWLNGNGPPDVYERGAKSEDREGRVGLPDIASEELNKLLDLVADRAPEDETLRAARRVSKAKLNDAINAAEAANKATDREWSKVVRAARRLVADVRKKSPDPAKRVLAEAALYGLEQRRHRAEATLNQEISALYGARVQVSSAESDKHRQKSQMLFVAMLVAQIGGVTASLGMARKQKSALWAFAALVGLVAIGVGAYGFLSTLIG
jgi:hypothetical protein